MKPFLRLPTIAALLLGLVFAGGCDTGTGETAIFNANTDPPPTVEYEFEYTSDDLNGQEQVEVVSNRTDNLGSVLQTLGFSRSDVVSARIDSVKLESVSSSKEKKATPKVFEYLRGAEVFLGDSASGTKIAEGEFQTTDRFIPLPVTTRDVTDIVKSGPTKTFLRLDVENPDNVPDAPNRDRANVRVYFRIEVQGV